MLIKEGDNVVMFDNSSNYRIIKVKATGKKIKHFKAMIDLSQLIGKEWGSFFEVKDSKSGQLQQVTDVHSLTAAFLEDVDFSNGANPADEEEEKQEQINTSSANQGSNTININQVTGRDNRDYVDDNKSQKLTHEQIEDLKKQGITGNELINHLVQNSDTFAKRTKFSQEKYLRKKKQKYLVTFQVKKPTAFELCNVYSQTNPVKIMALRPDSLGLLLNMANINYESRVLLCDKTRGLLAGSLVERDVREIMHVEFSGHQVKLTTEILMEFNFDYQRTKVIQYVQHSTINKEETKSDPLLQQLLQPKTKHFNSVMIVHDDYHPTEIYQSIEHLVQPSASVVAFSQYIQPLAELRDYLVYQKKAVNVRIEELWTREYQVLPLRTHPHMSMHGASGFVLSAVKVE
eukprot:403334251